MSSLLPVLPSVARTELATPPDSETSVKRKPEKKLPVPVFSTSTFASAPSLENRGVKKRRVRVISEKERNTHEALSILRNSFKASDIDALLSLDRALKLYPLPTLLRVELLLAKGDVCLVAKYTQRALETFRRGFDLLREKDSPKERSLKCKLCEKIAVAYRELVLTAIGVRNGYHDKALRFLKHGRVFCSTDEQRASLLYEKAMLFDALKMYEKVLEVAQCAPKDCPEISDGLQGDFVLTELGAARSLGLPAAGLLEIIERGLQIKDLSAEVRDTFLEDKASIVCSV